MKKSEINIEQLTQRLMQIQESMDKAKTAYSLDKYDAGEPKFTDIETGIKIIKPAYEISVYEHARKVGYCIYNINGDISMKVHYGPNNINRIINGDKSSFMRSSSFGDIYTIRMVAEKDSLGNQIWSIYEGYPITHYINFKPEGPGLQLIGKTHFSSKAKRIAYRRGDKVLAILKQYTQSDIKEDYDK